MKSQWIVRGAVSLATAAGLVAAWPQQVTSADSGFNRTYTTNADFDAQGIDKLFNVNHDVADQLQLNETLTTFPLMWVANAGEDTVSKIDTSANRETGRYRTYYPAGLHDAWQGPAPSRTAVDSEGNAYVLNRHFDGRSASLVKILAAAYIDRNGDGDLDTAVDSNNDGFYSLTEVLPLGPDVNGNNHPDSDSNGDGIADAGEIKDERVAWIVRVGNPNGLGRSLCIGTDGNLWVGLYNQQAYYKVGSATSGPGAGAVLAGPYPVYSTPYGCAVDSKGQLWSANLASYITRVNTNPAAGPLGWVQNLGHGGANYGITVGNGLVYHANLNVGVAYGTYNPATGQHLWGPGASGAAITVSLDGDNNVYSGSQGGATRKYTALGTLLWSAAPSQGGLDSRGTIVDSDKNIWRIHMNASKLVKYNGTTGAKILELPVGRFPYTYSDASGLSNLTNTSQSGTWTVVQDSGSAGTLWDAVTWNGQLPAASVITARVRAANAQAGLAAASWIAVTSGAPMPSVVGQYIEVEMKLTANPAGESPILSDVHITGHPPNSPPEANAGPDINVICGADNCQGSVHLDGSASTDPDMNPLTYSWSSDVGSFTGAEVDVLVPRGTHTFTLTVTDPAGATSTDTVSVTAVDLTPPALTLPSSVTTAQTACSGTPVSLGPASGADACGPVTVANNAPAVYGIGTTPVLFTATDVSGNQTTGIVSVTVVDQTAPAIGSATPSSATLWPPNHQMVPITVSWTFTDCDATTACSILSVSSNEPVNGLGDGNTSPDWEIVSNNTVRLRAERQGPESGRVYTITVRCVDAAGNASTRTTTVTVPHDQRGRAR